jgi:tetratricopeptide (TPR) repeat protein
MSNPEDVTRLKGRRLQVVVFLILGVFTFALYSRTYDYALALERDATYSFFLFDRQFLLNFLSLPGGLLAYAVRFLAQFYEYTWLGALVISVLVVGFGLLLHRLLRRLLDGAALFCALLPCILVATALNDVVVGIVTGLGVSMCAFLIYLCVPKGAVRRLYALLAIPALYLLSGGFFWLFALWVITAEWLEGRRPANLIWQFLFTAAAIATPVVAWRWLFLVTLRGAFLGPTVLATLGRPPLPALLVYGYLGSLPFWARAFARVRPAPAAGWNRRFLAGAAVLALLAVALQWVCYDANLNEFTEYRELYKQKRWDDILQKGQTASSEELMTQFFINCALYHKGRLLDELFRYRQAWGARGLILNSPDMYYVGTPENDLDRAMFNSDLFFEMGNVNAALMYAYNQMIVKGETYENVKRVAECAMVRGNYAWAMKFLTMLKRTLFHRAEALRYEALLADPKAREAYFAEQRSRLPTVELPIEQANFIPALSLLKSDPHNRMAFDYLTAWCLLDRQSLPMLAENVGSLKAAGYDYIPLALQESLLALETMSGRSLAPQGFRFDQGIVARFNAFTAKLRQSQGDSAAERALAQAFAGTFMVYAKFISPEPTVSYASAQMAVAKELRALGRTAEAIAHYEYALWINPGSAEAHAALAEMLKSQGRLEEAAFHEREAKSLAKTAAPQPAGVWESRTTP